jgi:hypothetical protein
MIPGIMVESDRDLAESIVSRLRESLTACGYQVSIVDRIDQSSDPVIVIQMDTLKNYLFSWIYPLGITWGNMQLSLYLMYPDGKEIWKATVEGSSGIMPSFLYMAGFESRVRDDLTTNVNQLIEVISSKEFQEQLKKAKGLPSSR